MPNDILQDTFYSTPCLTALLLTNNCDRIYQIHCYHAWQKKILYEHTLHSLKNTKPLRTYMFKYLCFPAKRLKVIKVIPSVNRYIAGFGNIN